MLLCLPLSPVSCILKTAVEGLPKVNTDALQDK